MEGIEAAKAAKASLQDALEPPAFQAYWEALSAFLRFEVSKPEFDERASQWLGAHAHLHNALVHARGDCAMAFCKS